VAEEVAVAEGPACATPRADPSTTALAAPPLDQRGFACRSPEEPELDPSAPLDALGRLERVADPPADGWSFLRGARAELGPALPLPSRVLLDPPRV